MKNLTVWSTERAWRTRFRAVLFGSLFLLLVLTLGGCDILEDAGLTSVDNVQIGMIENSGLNSTTARFHTLSGRKAWREALESGDTLSLEYEAELEKGSLTLQIENPAGDVLWEQLVTAGEPVDDAVAVNADSSGTYLIAVVGDDAGGAYELAWEQQE